MAFIIRVNMTELGIKKERVPDHCTNLGGRGLITEILDLEVKGSCHPLGKDNKLVIAPGLLSGTNIPCSGRLSVGSKSPLTYGYKEASAGGTLGHKLARLGVKAIIIEGKPPGKRLYVLTISKNSLRIEEATSLSQLGNYGINETLRSKYDGSVRIASIGRQAKNYSLHQP